MKRRTSAKVLSVLLVAILAMVSFLPLNAIANNKARMEYNLSGKITQRTVVESFEFNGTLVDALYTPKFSGYDYDWRTYNCAAYVKRFYKMAFGATVNGLNSIDSIPNIDSGHFMQTNSPKPGDIVRDNQSIHWAIVKSVEGDRVNIIQQNAWVKNKAMINASTNLYDTSYSYFTWSGNNVENILSLPQNQNISVEYTKTDISDHNIIAYAKVNNPNKVHVTTVGCKVWSASGELLLDHKEECSRKESRFNMWYDFLEELHMYLNTNVTLSYQYYVEYDGIIYEGAVQTATTTGGNWNG